jgi:hypothetical protein
MHCFSKNGRKKSMALLTVKREEEKELGRSCVQSHALRNKFFRNEETSQKLRNLCYLNRKSHYKDDIASYPFLFLNQVIFDSVLPLLKNHRI